jgi:putative DNA primase/helicase
MLAVNFDAIPQHMTSRKQWLLWQAVEMNGKIRKLPKQVDGSDAKSNTPSTWTGFGDVHSAYDTGNFTGIGYSFAEGDDLVGIDLDHCFEDGALKEWAREIVESFSSTYMEYSPSKEGIHIICGGKAPKTGHTKWDDENGKEVGFEVYDWTSPRYFTVTGNVAFQTNDIVECQDQLDRLIDQYSEKTTKKTPLKTQESRSRGTNLWDDPTFVENALKLVPADNYDEWIAVGMALKAGGFPVDMWDAWSQQSSKYVADECEKKWNTFNPSSVTVGKIAFLVQKYNPDFNMNVYLPTVRQLIREHQAAPVTPPPPNNVVPISNAPNVIAESNLRPIEGQPVEHHRWYGYGIPPEFRLVEAGLLKCSKESPSGELVSGPLFVTHNLVNPDEKNAGLLLEIETRSGQYVTFAMPRKMLHEDIRVFAGTLAEFNFYIKPGREKDLLRYLADSNPADTKIPVNQTGWINSDELVYVYTDSATDPKYQLQTGTILSGKRVSGSLNEWIENVWVPASTSSYGIFLVCAALYGFLLKPAQQDSGGFHLTGGSSSGKTTVLQVAASVHGSGADPTESGDSFIKRWNTTDSAQESVAQAANDSALLMDEIATCPSKDFGKALYNFAGGQGKIAHDSRRNLKAVRTWRSVILSTGEVSSRSKIEESLPGKKAVAKAGQLLRLIDIFINKPVFSSLQVNDSIKRNCSRYHGTLGPAFVEAIVQKFNSAKLRDTVQVNHDKATERLVNGRQISAVEKRALKRFALAEVAGLMLVNFQLIPGVTTTDIRNAIDAVVAEWTVTAKDLNDNERAITSLREFLLANMDTRIKPLRAVEMPGEKLNREIAGYYDDNRKAYFLLPAAFREATGCEPALIAEVLQQKGFLIKEDSQKGWTCRITPDDKRISTYGIRASLLSADKNEVEN